MTSPPSQAGAAVEATAAGLDATPTRRSPVRDLPALASAAIGVAWLLAHTGTAILDPTNTGWLKGGDWSVSQLGWTFFRTAPFGFPLGANPDYPHLVGSSLGFTGSLPPIALLLRPFASILPTDFQYLGPWVAACFALQGFVGAKLVRLVTEDRVARMLGGALFGLAPPLLHRVVGPDTGHASLCGHWILLAFLWLALAPAPRERLRARLAAAAGLLLLTTGVHPYLSVMGLVLALALVVRLTAVDRALRWPAGAAAAGAMFGATILGLALFGYLGNSESVRATGFGFYSADGLALLEPMGWSRFLPGHVLGAGQYEGFGYLGLGVLVLGGTALLGGISGWRGLLPVAGRSLPALAAVLALGLFALSGDVTVAGARAFTFDLRSHIPLVADAFRSSGRFVWPLHYFALLASTLGAAWALRQRPGARAASLAGALLLQGLDVRPPTPMEEIPRDLLITRSETWSLARGGYRHVALHPPILCAGSEVRGAASACCPVSRDDGRLMLAADVAARMGATFNSAYLARFDAGRAAATCAAAQDSVAAGALDPDTLYILEPAARPAFRAARARCGLIDGLIACIAGDRDDPFARALARTPFE